MCARALCLIWLFLPQCGFDDTCLGCGAPHMVFCGKCGPMCVSCMRKHDDRWKELDKQHPAVVECESMKQCAIRRPLPPIQAKHQQPRHRFEQLSVDMFKLFDNFFLVDPLSALPALAPRVARLLATKVGECLDVTIAAAPAAGVLAPSARTESAGDILYQTWESSLGPAAQ